MGFCTNCGGTLNEENICTNCGAKIIEDNAGDITSPELKKPNYVGLIIGAVVAIAVIIAAFFGIKAIAGSGYKSVVKTYVESQYKKADAKKYITILPNEYVDYVTDTWYDGDKEDCIDSLQDSLEERIDELEDEDANLKKLKYKITDVDDLDKDDIEDLCEDFEERFDEEIKIKAAKEVSVKVTYPMDDDEENDKFDLTIVKIGNSWKYLPYYN